MILCLIILIASIIALAVGVFAAYKARQTLLVTNWDYVSAGCLTFGAIAIIIITIVLIFVQMDCDKELYNFLNQKEYIENYEPTSEYDTATIANKKIELNEWLYSAQYTKERYPICSFYGDEILQIEPIK